MQKRFGLRVLLLFVALCCVIAAYVRVSLDRRAARVRVLRAEIIQLIAERKQLEQAPHTARPNIEIVKIHAEIQEKRESLQKLVGQK